MIILISHNQILVAIVPEKWMSLHLDQLVGGSSCVALRIVLEAIQMIQLNWDDGARLRVFNLECAVQDADLKPVISIELRDQVTCLVTQGELLRVA